MWQRGSCTRRRWRAGDALEFRCTYDNHDRFSLGYGLSAMNEMCGPILIYTPHQPTQHPVRSWYDSTEGMVRVGSGAAGAGSHSLDHPGGVRSRENVQDSSEFPNF